MCRNLDCGFGGMVVGGGQGRLARELYWGALPSSYINMHFRSCYKIFYSVLRVAAVVILVGSWLFQTCCHRTDAPRRQSDTELH